MTILMVSIYLMCCIVFLLAKKTKIAKSKKPLGPIVIGVPIVGFILFILDERYERKTNQKVKKIDLDQLKIEDLRYKHIEMNEEKHDFVIPLEEAMVLNDAQIRRKLMFDLLQKEPEEHVSLLQKARMSDDTELTHYATTMMMDIQSQYESEIRTLEQTLHKEKEEVALNRLQSVLRRYIKSGLLTGGVLQIYREKLDQVLEQLCKLQPDSSFYEYRCLENKIEMNVDLAFEPRIQHLLECWPQDEMTYRIGVEYYRKQGRGDEVKRLVSQIKQQEVYLTKEGRHWFDFWTQEENK